MLGVEVSALVLAFVAVLAGFVGRQLTRTLLDRLEKVASRTRSSIDNIVIDAVRVPAGWGSLLVGIWLATQLLPLPSQPVDLALFVDALAKGLSILLVVWAGIRLSDRICLRWAEKAQETETRLDDQAVPIIQGTMRVFLVLVGGALFLQNLGYSVGSLLAGLGLGGAAIALASKDTLANLFGAIVIFWDRPFEVGDWIEVGPSEGTVEEVGLRTTRIRTFANSMITLPNSQFTTIAVNNWSRMKKRRIKMTVGLTYDSSPEKMQEAVQGIRDIIRRTEAIHQDFYLVNFDAFGPTSLDIFIYCFTVTTNWAEFLAVKERFLLDVMKMVHGMGLSFAFPTQTVHVASLPNDTQSLSDGRPH